MFTSEHEVIKIVGAIRRTKIKAEQMALNDEQRLCLHHTFREAEKTCLLAIAHAVQSDIKFIDFTDSVEKHG